MLHFRLDSLFLYSDFYLQINNEETFPKKSETTTAIYVAKTSEAPKQEVNEDDEDDVSRYLTDANVPVLIQY